jgi:hypothetical protein
MHAQNIPTQTHAYVQTYAYRHKDTDTDMDRHSQGQTGLGSVTQDTRLTTHVPCAMGEGNSVMGLCMKIRQAPSGGGRLVLVDADVLLCILGIEAVPVGANLHVIFDWLPVSRLPVDNGQGKRRCQARTHGIARVNMACTPV